MPFTPKPIKIRKIKPRQDGTFEDVGHATDEAWWRAVLDDPKADTPRPQYGKETLNAMAGMLFGIRCEKCRKHANYIADDLIKMYGNGISAQTTAQELSECTRRTQGCFIRYVALPRTQRE